MSPLLLLAVMAIVPVLLLLVLRANAAIVFLSLCLGSVLQRFAGDDAHAFTNLFSGNSVASGYGMSLGLLLVPAVFTTLVMIGTVRGGFRLMFNILPAASVGLLAVLLAVPLVAPGLRGAIEATTAWSDVQRAQVLVITAGAIFSLLFLWLQRPKHHEHDKKHGKHH